MRRACKLALMVLFAGASVRLMQADGPPDQASLASKEWRPSADNAAAATGMKKFTVRGACVDEHGQPIAKARVRVFRYPSRLDAPLLVAELRADRDGRFAVDDVPTAVDRADFSGTGDVCVAVTAEGRESAVRWIDKETVRAAAPPIDPFAPRSATRPDQEIVEIAIRLAPHAGTLSGTVSDESGKPLAGVTVSLPSRCQQPLPGVQSAVTDAAGRYAIIDLKRWPADDDTDDDAGGNGDLRGDGKPQVRAEVASCTFLLDHPDYARTMAFFTAVPQTVDVVLHPPAIVAGTVFDSVAQRPAANVVVSAQGVARRGWYQTRTDRQGRYRLRMTKDHYNIWADADDRIAIAAKAVKAEPGTTLNIDAIPLVRGGFVTGRVLDQRSNEPVRPADDAPLYVAHYGPAPVPQSRRPKSTPMERIACASRRARTTFTS